MAEYFSTTFTFAFIFHNDNHAQNKYDMNVMFKSSQRFQEELNYGFFFKVNIKCRAQCFEISGNNILFSIVSSIIHIPFSKYMDKKINNIFLFSIWLTTQPWRTFSSICQYMIVRPYVHIPIPNVLDSFGNFSQSLYGDSYCLEIFKLKILDASKVCTTTYDCHCMNGEHMVAV